MEKFHCDAALEIASLHCKLWLITQTDACQASSENSHGRISPQMGRRLVTCRKPCGVTDPQCLHTWFGSKAYGGCTEAKSAGSKARCGSTLPVCSAGSPGAYKPTALQAISKKKTKKWVEILTTQFNASILKSEQSTLLFTGNLSARKVCQ